MTETLDEAKRRAKREIDLGAGSVRGGVITAVRGQSETYMAKEAEARAYEADPLPDMANYPMIAAEVGITGADTDAVAAAIITKASEWKILAAAIEAVRLGKKQEVDACTTVAEVYAVEATVAAAWPSPA